MRIFKETARTLNISDFSKYKIYDFFSKHLVSLVRSYDSALDNTAIKEMWSNLYKFGLALCLIQNQKPDNFKGEVPLLEKNLIHFLI